MLLILVSTSSLLHFCYGDQHIDHTEYIWKNDWMIYHFLYFNSLSKKYEGIEEMSTKAPPSPGF